MKRARNEHRGRLGTVAMSLLVASMALATGSVFAGSATWSMSPTSGDWNTAANWVPATVPNGPSDIATFSASNRATVSLSAGVEIDSIVFGTGASAFTIAAQNSSTTLTLSGTGVVNDSGITQAFVVGSDPSGDQNFLIFRNSATAGALTSYAVDPGQVARLVGGEILFFESSQAGSASFVINAARVRDAIGGIALFMDTASAATGVFTVNGGTSGSGGEVDFDGSASAGSATFTVAGAGGVNATGGVVIFSENSTAATGTFVTNGPSNGGLVGGLVNFEGSATAGDAVLIANPGSGFQFEDSSDGGSARVEAFGSGGFNIASNHTLPGATVGSVEGNGVIQVGASNLSIGSNSLSTTFSGLIADAPPGGSISKIGNATLTLTGANIYTGGTTVSSGTLVVSNKTGSATGTGAVSVNTGTLGGSGTVSGAVTIGQGGFVAPAHGTKAQATLTIQSGLTFNAGSTYTYTFKAKKKKAKTDKVVASGVTINSGATFNFSGTAQGVLKQGLVLTLISDTAATPIAGTFSNLPNGAILTVNGNNFQANYEGGDGNDLTLTVVP
ncbi:MAG: beta strand repeat-containing protein [Chthoniobacterales bacterium]